jgi:3-oxoacyl-[acyl-carrier-protein] synthase III
MDGLPSIGIISTGAYCADEVPTVIPRQRGGVDRRSAPALAAAAARRAVDAAEVAPEQLSYVVAAACVSGGARRAVAADARQLIGAHQAIAFDANTAYGGFVHALTMAEGVLHAEPVGTYALVVGADVGAGAGAGAVVLGPVPRGRGTISTSLLTKGDIADAVSDVLKRAGVARQDVRRVLVQESVASVPVALDRLRRQGRLDDGDAVVVCDAEGDGSIGCALLRWAGASAWRAGRPSTLTESCSLRTKP